MACFLVPAAEAVVATVVKKSVEKKEETTEKVYTDENSIGVEEVERIPFTRKLKWLTNMLWGGSVLLLFEHIWHGEITAWFPFLTAMDNPTDKAGMLHEMGTVGVAMALFITAVWGVMVAVSSRIEKRAIEKAKNEA